MCEKNQEIDKVKKEQFLTIEKQKNVINNLTDQLAIQKQTVKNKQFEINSIQDQYSKILQEKEKLQSESKINQIKTREFENEVEKLKTDYNKLNYDFQVSYFFSPNYK